MNYYVYDINTMKSSCQSFSALCFLGALCQMCMKGGHENGGDTRTGYTVVRLQSF